MDSRLPAGRQVAGSLGGIDAIEANMPRSRVINLQKEYVDKGYEIKVMKRKNQELGKRYKVALWWATMNNLPYDVLQFLADKNNLTNLVKKRII